MISEKVDLLNTYTRERYTQYLIGYAKGYTDTIVMKPGFYVDKTILKDIEKLVHGFFNKIVSEAKAEGVETIPLPIAFVFNEDETAFIIGYHFHDEIIESPFEYQITLLNKTQIN